MVRAVEHVVALHGFAGTGRSWEDVAAGIDAPDLPGHGSASGRRPIDLDYCVRAVLDAAPERFALAGYSMGGRIALHVALAAPERASRLILVSTSAGIEDEHARRARRAADEALAARFELESIAEIARCWTGQPLFADDPPAVRARQAQDVMRNEPAGLAAALRGLGVGAMAPVWERLAELTMPATLLAGGRDGRYVALARRMAADLGGPAEMRVVPGAGHGLLREAPQQVAAALAG